MSKKKILVVFDGLNFGGIERVGINYLKIFDSLDYDVTILNLLPQKEDMVSEIPENFEYIVRNFSRFKVIETYSQKFDGKIWWKIIYPFVYLVLLVNMLFLRKIKGKYDIAIAFSGHFNDLRIINSNKVVTKYKLAWIHGSMFSYIALSNRYYEQYNQIKNLVVLSNQNDKLVDVEKYNIKRIYNPVDISEKEINLQLVDSLKREYGDYILMVARFTKQKDHLTIIKAAKELKTKHNLSKKLLFVGDGETISQMKKLTKDLKLEQNIYFLGSKNDVQNYYRGAFVFVHASPEEGLPTVIIEAMFNGLPIVTTKSLPGVMELIPTEEYGLLCELQDYECIANKISLLYNDPEKYNYYQRKSIERSEIFKFDNVKKEIKALINDLKE